MRSTHLVSTVRGFSVAVLFCTAAYAGQSVSLASKQATVTAPVQPQEQLKVADSAANKDDSELKERIKTLEERERAVYAMVLEGQRKGMDWWLSILGLAFTIFGLVVAVVGILIPVYWQRRERERVQEAQTQADTMLRNAEQTLTRIALHEKDAATASGEAKESAAKAQQAALRLSSFQSNDSVAVADKSKSAEDAKTVLADPVADDLSKLRALAVKAADANDVAQAAALWRAIAVKMPNDASAQFNAGYWMQRELAFASSKSPQDWRKVSEYYANHFALDGSSHWGLNNWGNALDAEAKALSTSDLPGARALWAQAGEKFAQALRIKSDKHEAANNWGIALSAEARAISAIDLPGARALWAQAAEKYAQALRIKSDDHDAVFNWANALSAEARALSVSDLPGARALWTSAGEKYAQALRIKPDRHLTANSWANALSAEARALSVSDLPGARALWTMAGEKYAQALNIKPDKCEAANNWGNALDEEARALSASNLSGARALWARADEKYAQALHVKSDDYQVANNRGTAMMHEAAALGLAGEVNESKATYGKARLWFEEYGSRNLLARDAVAYNLACAYARQSEVQACVEQLEYSRLAGHLPEKAHLISDEDLNAVRATEVFREWWHKHFPD